MSLMSKCCSLIPLQAPSRIRPSVPLTPGLQDAGDSAALPRGVRLHALLDHAGRLHCGPGHRGHLLQVTEENNV